MDIDIKLNVGTFVLVCVIGGLSYAVATQTKKVISLQDEVKNLKDALEALK